MKKMILIPAAAGVLAFGGIVLANTDSNNGSNTEAPSTAEVNTSPVTAANQNSGEMIGFEKASAVALAIADGKVTDIELSEDDGRQEYEVEIRDAEYEYDFDIDAFSGDVVEQDRERLRDDDDSRDNSNQNGEQQSSANKQNNKDAAKAVISAEQAKEIALNETGGGNIVDFDLDSDDGRQHYDVEIVNGNIEYEIEINAADGSIVEFEQDDEDDDWDEDDR